jgi:superfamily II DNA or RNA helicase
VVKRWAVLLKESPLSTTASEHLGVRRTSPELRPYQQDVIARVNAEIAAGKRRILIVAPTGSGKTVIAAAIIAEAVRMSG